MQEAQLLELAVVPGSQVPGLLLAVGAARGFSFPMMAWELSGNHLKCTWHPLHLAKYFSNGKEYQKIAHSDAL